jgi:serine kinase of HPr protein (carbohydrate metabolism regulator)
MWSDGGTYYIQNKPPSHDSPFWTAEFDRTMDKALVYCGDRLVRSMKKVRSVVNPVHYPLDQLLLMNFLISRSGTIIHAAGLRINGRGYMFPGRSGAGKSTLSRYLRIHRWIEMLSDDRVVVRKMKGKFKVFGTPWGGEEGIAENRDSPLQGIFYICRGDENRIDEITSREAMERLMQVTSIPWYDRDSMMRVLDLCEDMALRVPAYEFRVKPGREVIDVFEQFISA